MKGEAGYIIMGDFDTIFGNVSVLLILDKIIIMAILETSESCLAMACNTVFLQ